MATQEDIDAVDVQIADLNAQRAGLELEVTSTAAAESLSEAEAALAAAPNGSALIALGMTLVKSTGHPQWVEVVFPIDEAVGTEIGHLKQMGGESPQNRKAGCLSIHKEKLIDYLTTWGTIS